MKIEMEERMKTERHREVERELNCYSFKEMALEIGERIRIMRKQDGMTMMELSCLACIEYETLQRMETGRNQGFPSFENLLKVAYGLDVHVTTLLGGF